MKQNIREGINNIFTRLDPGTLERSRGLDNTMSMNQP